MEQVEKIIKNYSIVVGHPYGQSLSYFTSSEKNLVNEFKDAILSKSKFLTWENGCFELDSVLGVFNE